MNLNKLLEKYEELSDKMEEYILTIPIEMDLELNEALKEMSKELECLKTEIAKVNSINI